jgi:hypothetical protein
VHSSTKQAFLYPGFLAKEKRTKRTAEGFPKGRKKVTIFLYFWKKQVGNKHKHELLF